MTVTTEMEGLLIESLRKLNTESAERERRLTELLNDVSKRLDALQERMQALAAQLKTLEEDIQR